jgi:cell division protein FtsB
LIGLVQAAGRVVLALVALGLVAVVGLQVARVVRRNVVLASELHTVTRQVSELQHRRVAEERTIRRLRDPAGTIPEIHDRLHLTRPDEAIIYVRGSGIPTSAP